MSTPEMRSESEQNSFEAGEMALKLFVEHSHKGYRKAVVEGMAHAFMREHRTIQQETVKHFVQMLQLWGDSPEARVSDLRNQATYQFAQKLIQDQPCFPFI